MKEQNDDRKYKTGNLVKLKSGGPVMTIKGIYMGNYRCQWFAGKKLTQGDFPEDSLNLSEDTPNDK